MSLKLEPMVCNAVKHFINENNHMNFSPPFECKFDGAIMQCKFEGVQDLHEDLMTQGSGGSEALGHYLSVLLDEATRIITKCGGDISKVVDGDSYLVVWQPLQAVTNLRRSEVLAKQVHK